MIKKLLLLSVLAIALPIGAVQIASGAACKTWNAKNPASHHKAGPVDVVGGKGYGSGHHQSMFQSPPTALGAYGDPKRRAAEGGYVQVKSGTLIVNVNLFGPSDENDTTHLYDTVFGACVSSGNTGVNTGERCLATSRYKKPAGAWTPCGGY